MQAYLKERTRNRIPSNPSTLINLTFKGINVQLTGISLQCYPGTVQYKACLSLGTLLRDCREPQPSLHLHLRGCSWWNWWNLVVPDVYIKNRIPVLSLNIIISTIFNHLNHPTLLSILSQLFQTKISIPQTWLPSRTSSSLSLPALSWSGVASVGKSLGLKKRELEVRGSNNVWERAGMSSLLSPLS